MYVILKNELFSRPAVREIENVSYSLCGPSHNNNLSVLSFIWKVKQNYPSVSSDLKWGSEGLNKMSMAVFSMWSHKSYADPSKTIVPSWEE